MEKSANLENKEKPVDSNLKRDFIEAETNCSSSAKVQRKGSTENVGDSRLLETDSNVKTSNDLEDGAVSTKKQVPSAVSPDDIKMFNDMRSCRGPIKNLVMIKMGSEVPLSQLNRLSCIWKRPFRLSHESLGGGNWHAKVIFDGVTWCETWGQNKASRKMACEAALWKMNQYFYLVEMGRNSIGEVYFDRSEMTTKVNKEYISNVCIPPSNKDEPPDTDGVDLNQTSRMYRIAKLDNPKLFQPFKDNGQILQRLKAVVDKYHKDEADTCELLFVRQYPLPVYMPIMDYATQLGLLAKCVGSAKDRMVVVYKANTSSIKTNWQLIWNLAIMGKEDVEGLKIHPPKSLLPPKTQKGLKLKF